MASDKINTRKINRYFLEQNMGLFFNATWQHWAKAAKFYWNIAFLIKELNSNWLETLRIEWNHWVSPLYINRERLKPFIIWDMSYDYNKNDKYRQKRKICRKNSARKGCPLNQLDIKLITKNKKKYSFAFFAGDNICKSIDAHYCDTVNRKQTNKKGANLQKSRKLILWKLVVPKRKTIWGK